MDIHIAVHPSPQPNRITCDIPPCFGIIIPIPVIVKPRLPIEVLPREAKVNSLPSQCEVVFFKLSPLLFVLLLYKVLAWPVIAKRIAFPAPDDVAARVSRKPRGI